MSSNMKDINSPEAQNVLNKYLSTPEGAEEAAKAIPVILSSTISQNEKAQEDVGEQIITLASGYEKLTEQNEAIQQILAQLIQYVGFKPQGSGQAQASAQIQPKQSQQAPQGILENTNSLLERLGQGNTQQ